MDFYKIRTGDTKKGHSLYPDFKVGRSKDLMILGKKVAAIWDEKQQLWSTDEYDVQRLVDEDLEKAAVEHKENCQCILSINYMESFDSRAWSTFQTYVKQLSDNAHPLDSRLTFLNTEVKKNDYVTRRLPYALEQGDHSAWDELTRTLYSDEERAKIEWAIGSIVAGEAYKIQKFLVFFGAGGTGKSTILNIVQDLFDGYYSTFDSKDLTSANGQFATSAFKTNPLVAIQHDGDLSNIADNARLNMVVSHEDIQINEKNQPMYTMRLNAMVLMGTNKPVKITDANSGMIRRLIDVRPTGNTFSLNHYTALMSRVAFELGAIAYHCKERYLEMGRGYYADYKPLEMMFQTDVFFNFIDANYETFERQDGTTLDQAYVLYKQYCEDSQLKAWPRHRIREELKSYFEEFHERMKLNGEILRSYYAGFNINKFRRGSDSMARTGDDEAGGRVLDLVSQPSVLDATLADCPAQYASGDRPSHRWDNVQTTLADLDTSETHYVRVPLDHIVIDFDIRGDDGEKSLELNIEAANQWPPTYAEVSKSGGGVHLHYAYGGDVSQLSNKHSDGIEIKTFEGKSSLRRKVTLCNNLPVATISSGLPLKEKKLIDSDTMKSEKTVRMMIEKNLNKDFHLGTKPSVDFIKKILDDASASGMKYDVTDMRSRVVAFAAASSNQSEAALKVVQGMKWSGGVSIEEGELQLEEIKDAPITFFDVEVYPNLFVVVWKHKGEQYKPVRMINPSPLEIEQMMKFKLVGFFNRKYDNHILWARYMGYLNEELFALSQKLVEHNTGTFAQAYGLSYCDIYEFSSVKKSLKKFQIDLGIHHMEMDLPWDEPVPEELWPKVVEYCVNDVLSTEAVFDSRAQDFQARLVLAELSGLSPNDTTQKHTAKLLFGDDPNPQQAFVYTDLSERFPGYRYDQFATGQKSFYRDEDPSEGGYVYAEPGMYTNVALLDVASMHPSSIEILNAFGPYTEKYIELKNARLAIKRGDFAQASRYFGGRLSPFLGSPENSDALSYALKIVINIVYGLTSAKFDNPFRDPRNVDNIVAKRGALFMIDLKKAVQEKGFTVAHIKTDSIKIPDATQEIIDFVFQFGEDYGYQFEHEATYEKFCLVNDAVYVAKKAGKDWEVTGAQFAHPYVYKTLFQGGVGLEDRDFEEARSVVQGAMYLDFNADKPMVFDTKSMRFVGKTGLFVPVLSGGGELLRIKDDKKFAVTDTKGYHWMEAEVFRTLEDVQIDMAYFDEKVDHAYATLAKFGDTTEFLGESE